MTWVDVQMLEEYVLKVLGKSLQKSDEDIENKSRKMLNSHKEQKIEVPISVAK